MVSERVEGFDVSVTRAEVLHRLGGTVETVRTHHEAGDYNYAVTVHRFFDDGFRSFTPIQPNGAPVVTQETKSLFQSPSSEVKTVDFGKTMRLLAAARQHVNEHYDFEVGQALWFHNYEGNDE